jgi:hypothetical protein
VRSFNYLARSQTLARQHQVWLFGGLFNKHIKALLHFPAIAFSSEVYDGSREENAPKQKIKASVPIQSEP